MKKAYEAPAVYVQEFELEGMQSICTSSVSPFVPAVKTITLRTGVLVIPIIDDTTSGT
jgi:hypothetical protein